MAKKKENVVVEENIRALQTGVEHPPEPLDTLADIRGQGRQQETCGSQQDGLCFIL